MKIRSLKVMALITASGTLFQIAGCGGAIQQLVVNQVITRALVKLLDVLLGNNDSSTTA